MTAAFVVVTLASAGLVLGLSAARATVYQTPGHEVAVATAGENVTAANLAVSNGGNAETYSPASVALSTAVMANKRIVIW